MIGPIVAPPDRGSHRHLPFGQPEGGTARVVLGGTRQPGHEAQEAIQRILDAHGAHRFVIRYPEPEPDFLDVPPSSGAFSRSTTSLPSQRPNNAAVIPPAPL